MKAFYMFCNGQLIVGNRNRDKSSYEKALSLGYGELDTTINSDLIREVNRLVVYMENKVKSRKFNKNSSIHARTCLDGVYCILLANLDIHITIEDGLATLNLFSLKRLQDTMKARGCY